MGGSHPAFARSHKSLTGCGPLLSVSDGSVREEDFKTALEWRVVDSDTENADVLGSRFLRDANLPFLDAPLIGILW